MFDVASEIPAPITLLLGLVLLVGGGTWLVSGAVRIARRFGVSTLLIGLTIVAFGTSSPELAFNLIAARGGHGDLSFGNVVGSNIANIALVLGLASLATPLVVSSRVIRKELPLLVGASLLMVVLAWLPPSRIEHDGGQRFGYTRLDGLVLLGCFAFVLIAWYRLAKRDRADPLALEAEAGAVEVRPGTLPLGILLTAVGLISVITGGKLTEIGAVTIAEAAGLSHGLIGLTIVAVATSLPEVVTSIIAARRGHADLAVGNVVGSNLFNILLVLGVTAVFAPVSVPAGDSVLGLTGGWWDLLVMVALTLMLIPIVLTNQRRILKGEGLLLLACYAAYMVFRVVREVGI
jgi:cation:H+ antiporter